jgi:hypothetical protein
MTYTRLRLAAGGIVLCRYHERRLALDADGGAAFARFARTSAPGVWVVWTDAAGLLHARPGGASALRDGMPVRWATSPLAGGRGPVPKSGAPSVYDALRVADVETILLSGDGREVYESCRAAALGWDGERIVCVPHDRPRIWSTTETAVREHLPVLEAPLPVTADLPLLLVNAVVGTCAPALPGRPPFPPPARQAIEGLLAALTAWPAGAAETPPGSVPRPRDDGQTAGPRR